MEVDTLSPTPQPPLPQGPLTAENHIINAQGEFLIKFPPFPQASEGVEIMPFKQFKERGIRVDPGPDDAEVDALGIPTVPLKTHHKTDICKSNTKRKRTSDDKEARKQLGLPPKKLAWYEEWEETEAVRFSYGFDPLSTRAERLQAAANDFTSGRKWPVHFLSETGPKFIWEKFQRYIGLTVAGPVSKKKKRKQHHIGIDPPDDSDDDEADMDKSMRDATNPVAAAVVEEEEDDVAEEEPEQENVFLDKDIPAQRAFAQNEQKMQDFLDKPEKAIKIFLSSYARSMGFIWSDVNNECIGRVVQFFVNFTLRSKVLPEIERGLRRSQEIIALSITEIPNAPKIAKTYPDDFSKACKECWGKKMAGYHTISIDLSNVPEIEPAEAEQDTVDEIAKIVEVDSTTGDVAISDAPGWDVNTEGGWGTSAGWDTPGDSENNPWTDTSENEIKESVWAGIEPNKLSSLLGPTSFPLTHTAGLVEQSMRRIKAIIPPSGNPPKSSPQAVDVYEPDAEAVEVDLDKEFYKVVLEPMVDWDGGESPTYSRPTLLKPDNILDKDRPDPAQLAEGATVKEHDPLNDEITLLIEAKPERLEFLTVGTGLGGVYVQIARQGDATKKKKKGKGKSKKVVPNYWYLNDLLVIIPSFWTV